MYSEFVTGTPSIRGVFSRAVKFVVRFSQLRLQVPGMGESRKEERRNRAMKHLEELQDHPASDPASENTAWRPEVLEGLASETNDPPDLDLSEVWSWLHARLRAIGALEHDPARLVALLTWNETAVDDALHAARLEINQLEEEGATRQVHLEYLTAEYLAHLALEDASIPSAGPHST